MRGPTNVTSAAAAAAANRRREADLLVCRLLSEWNRLHRDLGEVRAAALAAQPLTRELSDVADNLHGSPSELMAFDLRRLLTLIQEGF